MDYKSMYEQLPISLSASRELLLLKTFGQYGSLWLKWNTQKSIMEENMGNY